MQIVYKTKHDLQGLATSTIMPKLPCSL